VISIFKTHKFWRNFFVVAAGLLAAGTALAYTAKNDDHFVPMLFFTIAAMLLAVRFHLSYRLESKINE
jgi:hypothetical protein